MGVAGAELIIIHVFLNTSTFHMVYLLCEKCNLDFRYKIHYKNMSSDWAKYLGMCLWRYYVLLTFEILKHEYLLCEECNLVFRYKIHYKNMSSDWAKNLGMCLWRYYVPLIFEILKHEYLKINLQKHEFLNFEILKHEYLNTNLQRSVISGWNMFCGILF